MDLGNDQAALPPPPVPADADLRRFPHMGLHVERLRSSGLVVKATGDEFRAAILLMASAWHQVPAGSLPDDDEHLAALANLGLGKRAVGTWRKLRNGALRGWFKASDGRLYHPFLSEVVLDALKKKRTAQKERLDGNKRQREYEDRKRNKSERSGHTTSELGSEYDASSDASDDDVPDEFAASSDDRRLTVQKEREEEPKRQEPDYYPPPPFPGDHWSVAGLMPAREGPTWSMEYRKLIDVFPKSTDLHAAYELYKDLTRKEGHGLHEVILKGAQRYRQQCLELRTEPAAMKGLKTWIQSRGWEDKGVTIPTASRSHESRSVRGAST